MLPVDTSTGALTVYFLSYEAYLAAFRFDRAVGVERFKKKKTRKKLSESSFPEQTQVVQLVSFIEFYFMKNLSYFLSNEDFQDSWTKLRACTLSHFAAGPSELMGEGTKQRK